MPSGSHSGGGGHSGGFSGGGGSWGGHSGHGGGSSSPIFPRSTRNGHSVVIIGGFGGHPGRYVRSGIFTLISALLWLGIFMALFFGVVFLGSENANTAVVMADYQHDYDYYQAMISYAEENPEYMLTTGATITDRFIGKGGNKYYLTYKFYTSDTHRIVEGYTYTTYTLDDLKKPEFQVGQTIVLALNCKNTEITSATDSIDINYKNTTLWDDDDFVTDYNSAKGFRIFAIVSLVVGISCIVAAVTLFIVYSKKDNGETTETTVSTKERKEYCKYCGTLLKSGASKCDNCGASITENKMEETSSTTVTTKNK